MELCNQKSSLVLKSQKGFVFILLLPVIALVITGTLGISTLAVGIKNISAIQSICIVENLSLHKKLIPILNQLLSLNIKVRFLHKQKYIVKQALKKALILGYPPTILALKTQLMSIKWQQKIVTAQQNHLLQKSQKIKQTYFNNLKKVTNKSYVQSVTDKSYKKNALALKRHKLEQEAIIYKPLLNFSNQQKTTFSWEMNPFFPLLKTKFSKYHCTATLQKQANTWKERLFH